MDLLRWNGIISLRAAGAGRSVRRRASMNAKPACEPLDGRQLLSTVPAVALGMPPATAVANAATDLNALDSKAFAKFQSDLAKAESHSHVTEAAVTALAQDESDIDQAIEASDLLPDPSKGVQNEVEDVIDTAFTASSADLASWARGQRADLRGYVISAPGAEQYVNQTVVQMEVVAREAHVTPQLSSALATDQAVLRRREGPNPDTDLGPGAVNRDPLAVYYDGQVDNFIKD